MSQLAHDLRAAARSLWRRPLHALIAGTILALGLAAGVAVFTFVNGYSRPFPGVDPDGLVRLFGVEDDNPYLDISYLDYLDYADSGSAAFEGIAGARAGYLASVRHEAMTEVAFVEAVSRDYFTVLRVEIGAGRALVAADDRPDAEPVAVISHNWWQRSFGGEDSVIGRTVYLNFRPFTVVGVAAPEHLGATSGYHPDVWIPIAPFRDRYTSWDRLAQDRDVPAIRVYGRLAPGVRRTTAQDELRALAAGLDDVYPRQAEQRRIRLEQATWIDPRERLAEVPTVRLMIGAAGGLLLLVCANVANLLLALAAGRDKEVAIRAAIGAAPGRLIRQVLAENVLLSSAAGLVALLLAHPITTRLGSYFAAPSVWGVNVPREAAIDLRVVGFAVAAAVLTGLLAGLLPALRGTRRDLVVALKAGFGTAVTGADRRGPGIHDALVTTQVALAVVLLVVAGLVLRTLASAAGADPGFEYRNLVASYISTSSTSVQPEERDQWFRELAENVAAEPWVRSATISQLAPLSPHRVSQLRLEGQSEPVPLVIASVQPGFFGTLGLQLLAGRRFASTDIAGSLDVAIINETVARRYFDDRHPIGRRLWLPAADGGSDRELEIVGIVQDARVRSFLDEPDPIVYLSYPQQRYPSGSALVVATRGDPGAAVPLLYRWLREYEPHVAIVNALPYTEVVRGFLYAQRMNAEMFSALAFLGLGLAAVGIFSVMSLAVSRRTREIGIRMAIGAQRADICRLVVRRALGPVVAGLGLGLGVSLTLTGLVQGLLYGVEPTDPLTLASGATVLIAAAIAAGYLPARRATSVEPITALRR